jgi:hypothetical protein
MHTHKYNHTFSYLDTHIHTINTCIHTDTNIHTHTHINRQKMVTINYWPNNFFDKHEFSTKNFRQETLFNQNFEQIFFYKKIFDKNIFKKLSTNKLGKQFGKKIISLFMW